MPNFNSLKQPIHFFLFDFSKSVWMIPAVGENSNSVSFEFPWPRVKKEKPASRNHFNLIFNWTCPSGTIHSLSPGCNWNGLMPKSIPAAASSFTHSAQINFISLQKQTRQERKKRYGGLKRNELRYQFISLLRMNEVIQTTTRRRIKLTLLKKSKTNWASRNEKRQEAWRQERVKWIPAIE